MGGAGRWRAEPRRTGLCVRRLGAELLLPTLRPTAAEHRVALAHALVAPVVLELGGVPITCRR